MSHLGFPATLSAIVLSFAACGQANTGFDGSDAGRGDAPHLGEDGPASLGEAGSGGSCARWIIRDEGPGPDGKLGTSDDVEIAYSAEEFDAFGQVVRETVVNSPGPDGKWETSDDPIESLDQLTLASDGSIGNDYGYPAVGPDGKWADAVATSRIWFGFDTAGQPGHEQDFDEPGPDGKWGDADDVMDRWYHRVFGDGTGNAFLVSEKQYIDPGPDGIPDTADDPVSILTTRYPAYGTFADGAGPDGLWGTSDDHLTGRYTNLFSPKGYMSRSTLYVDPGPDGEWGTPDDPVDSYASLECMGTGASVLLFSGPGPDGLWFTKDDEVAEHTFIVGCDDSVCKNTSSPGVGSVAPK
jgi:hypothetical protein